MSECRGNNGSKFAECRVVARVCDAKEYTVIRVVVKVTYACVSVSAFSSDNHVVKVLA